MFMMENINVNIVTPIFEDETEEVKDIFKREKTNVPKSKPPQSLQTYLNAVKSDILGSCKQPRRMKNNLPQSEQEAIKQLSQAQASGLIQIKPVDKGGGMAILNSKDYINEMNQQLNAIFTHQDGSILPFYEKTSIKELEKQKHIIVDIVKKGFD